VPVDAEARGDVDARVEQPRAQHAVQLARELERRIGPPPRLAVVAV